MLQSTILYKVSDPGEIPLDRNGVPVSVSGERQAIAILDGTPNPNVALYEVVATFTVGSMFRGVKTFRLDPSCGAGILRVSPARLDVSEGPQIIELISGSAWSVLPQSLLTLDPDQGEAGGYRIDATSGPTEGQGWVTFVNTSGASVRIYVINLPGALWILEDGTWNNNGKWVPDGIWNY